MATMPGNLSAVLRCAGELVLEDRPLPQAAGRGEVLLSIQSVGVCGSDVHFWVNGKIGDFTVESPMILGHEASAMVVGVGEGVTHLKQGDRVAIEPGIACRHCSQCKEGRYNLCPEVKFGSCPPVDGFLTRYVTHPADLCYKLPDNVSCDEGALLEPLSVGVHACQRAGIKLGSKVLVCGAGPIGLVCMLTAKACGASQVLVTDIDEHRLQVAKEIGATYTVKVTSRDSRALANEIEATLGCQPDCSMECSGAEPSIATAIHATRPGGVVMVVGLGAAEVKVPLVSASLREVDIRGVLRYATGCYAAALDMVASGRVNVKPLITHTYKLEETLQAYERAKTGKGGAIKVVIRCASQESNGIISRT